MRSDSERGAAEGLGHPVCRYLASHRGSVGVILRQLGDLGNGGLAIPRPTNRPGRGKILASGPGGPLGFSWTSGLYIPSSW